MNTIDEAKQSPKTAAPAGVPNTNNILFELWKRAAPSLDQEALKWFAGSTDQAESLQSALAGNFQSGLQLQADWTTSGGFPISAGRQALNRPELYR